jgi:endonuclease YncB( thermonuclease family)
LALGSSVAPKAGSRSEPAAAPSSAPVIRVSAPAEVRIAHPAEVLRVLDGDTFEARVHLWPGLDVTTRVRLRGIDAPELKARCIDERKKAEAARDALRAMLDQGGVGIMRVALDKYGGRVVADASTRSVPDVAESLLNAGHVRRYGAARREPWCS